MIQPQEKDQVNLSAQNAQPQPSPGEKNPPKPDLSGVNINTLRKEMADKEAALKKSINDTISDKNLKTKLLDQIAKDNTFVQNSGIDALDDSKKNAKLNEGSSGLTDYQNKTKKFFEDELAKTNNEIVQQLNELHQARLNVLNKSLQEEDEKVKADAYGALTRMGFTFDPEKEPPGGKATEKSEKKPSNFLDRLAKEDTNQISNGKSIIHHRDGVLTSNDPEALGLAAAAAGFKEVEFSGHPVEMLAAARAALKNGVQAVSFDRDTVQAIYNMNTYNTRKEFYDSIKEFESIQNIVKGNQVARKERINNAFNTDSLPDYVHKFNSLSPLSPGQKMFVDSLTPEEQITLAEEIKENKYTVNGTVYSGYQLIRGLLGSENKQKGWWTKDWNDIRQNAFDRAYAKQVVESSKPILAKLETSEQVAEFIFNQKEPDCLRSEFYQEIKNLKAPARSGLTDKDFQTEVRAHLVNLIIAKYIPTYIKSRTNFFKAHPHLEKCPNEVLNGALHGLTTKEQMQEVIEQAQELDLPTVWDEDGKEYVLAADVKADAYDAFHKALEKVVNKAHRGFAPNPTPKTKEEEDFLEFYNTEELDDFKEDSNRYGH